MDESSFGPRLRAWRRQLNLTQEELARRAGVPRQALSDYERGHSSPKMATASKIAEGLGLASVADVFGATPDEVASEVSERSLARHAARPAKSRRVVGLNGEVYFVGGVGDE